ncbi:SRPBCC family protein [Gordonia phthalatica]|uniref:Polyketide cyclase n=1 Tax=Gordonia phthalatica TaxID=1136941 RepID=A0A0N9N6W3_9ACTN|nr:SRPBCC family protein [Gordonia phthalatica]ALG86325.1 polyketide cyclase [Gordonia phthalatica]
MGRIEFSKTVSADPAALWTVMANPATWSDWFSIHERWMEEPPATLEAGSRLTVKILMLGMANKLEWTVDAVDAPTSMTLSGTGMAGVKVQFAFTVTPVDGCSEIQISGDFEGALIKGALGKAVEKDGRKQLEKSVTALENLALA